MTWRTHIVWLATLLTVAVLAAPMALAAGSSSRSVKPTRPSDYDRAVRAVQSGHYRTAVDLLHKVVARDSRNADAYNYLAFSERKLGQFDSAMEDYRKALAINPRHRGANEYLGELYLDLGNLAEAEAQLAKLDQLCQDGCSERDDLKAAIDRYKKTSHRG